MADNKFIERLKGQPTAGSLVEIKNTSAKTSFANMPNGTSNANDVYSDHRGNATIVANGTLLWKVDGETLEPVESVFGDGKDFLSVQSVAGSGLWLNASYTFPSTGDPNHPVAMVFNPNTKWVLKLCGDNLIVDGGNVVDFTLIVKIGSAHIFSKNFKVAENAGQFSKEFILDFEETNTGIVKAGGLAKLTLQLLCGTENASARIYNGMTVLTCLQRKVDASAVSSTNANVQDVLDGNIIPEDYFSNPEFIDQIEDGKDAYAVFNRDGDSVFLSGWTPKEDVATAVQLNTEIQNRISADDALGLRIDNEATARESADNALGARIDNVINDLATETTARENADTALQGQITSNKNAIDTHVADTANPHNVTKAQVGLGNVDNTSDLNKPISTATQTALDLKADKSTTYTKNETDTLLGAKQDTISDLSTIRSNAQAGKTASDTIATYGNIVTHNVSEFATATQGVKADTAVQPSDLATVATTGNYNDLNNKPTIPAAQVNADWNAKSGVAEILNKPALATVATSGSYNDLSNKPTIPTVNNPTITITQGGVTKGSFTLNQATDDTIALDAGGGSGSGYHPDLFDHKWADHQLNDVSWLRADTFSWQSGDVYVAAYQHLAGDIDGKTLQSETIGGTTIQFYLADDGHKICPASEESNVSTIYNSTGVAWYYILDTTNQRFKLPRTKWGFTGLRDSVGKYIPESLPNITGQITSDRFGVYGSKSSSGAFSVTDGGIYGAASNTDEHHMKVSFSAHNSNTTYQDGAPVQERATQMYLYFYVGNFTQSAIEQTAGITAETLNGKADTDLGNIPANYDYVVEKQDPTSANGYTWYRKYKSGWVEQGGIKLQNTDSKQALSLPIEMNGSTYSVLTSVMDDNLSDFVFCVKVTDKTTTGFKTTIWGSYQQGTLTSGYNFVWQVSGVSAQ